MCNIYSAQLTAGEFVPHTVAPAPLERGLGILGVSWVFFAAAYIFITQPLKYHSC